MKGRISRRTLEELKTRSDISDVVSDYVVLRQSGASLKGLCPFHEEKTPSFFVSRDKGVYHCFGCGAGGDSINFLMKMNSLDYREAVEDLCEKYGLEIEYEGGSERDSIVGKMFDATAFAADHYHSLLIKKQNPAISYLKKRMVSEESVKELKLGYGGEGGKDLAKSMKIKGIDINAAVQCGLLYQGSGGEYVDRFSRRLIFPIRTPGGRVAGFAGRSLDGRDPKYINSADSKIYRKKNVLYGQDLANRHIRKRGKACIVEGYMDWIAMWQAGMKNVVATCGTAVTKNQFLSVKKVSNKVILLLDGDRAGKMAAMRAISPAYESGLSPYGCFPPDGLDPDDWIKRDGPDRVRKSLDDAGLLVEMVIRGMATKFDLKDISQKMEYMEKVEQFIQCVRDPVEKALYVKELAVLVGIREEEVGRRFTQAKGKNEPNRRIRGREKESGLNVRAEELLIGYLAKYPFKRGSDEVNSVIHLIKDPGLKNLIEMIGMSEHETDRGVDSSIVIGEEEDFGAKIGESVIIYERLFPVDREENLDKILGFVRLKHIEEEIGSLREAIEREADTEERKTMLRKQARLQKEMEEYKKIL